MSKYQKPKFSIALLHPKYWGVWAGFGFLALLVNLLPYSILFRLGRGVGLFGMRFGKKRVHVAKRNLELAFPDKNKDEIDAIVVENFKNTGFALIEMGMAWFWPTWRMKLHLTTDNFQPMFDFEKQGKGVLLCFTHALNLEFAGRGFAIMGVHGHGVYRPHSNPAYDFIQSWGRTHNGNTIIDRKDVKQMIRALKQGERVFYLGDHDYGRNKSVFVPFFAVEDACTTTGASILAHAGKCAIIPGSGFRNSKGIYELIMDDPIHEQYPARDAKAAAAILNKSLEKVILRGLEQWMWLHKRYKTMEDESQPKGIRYK